MKNETAAAVGASTRKQTSHSSTEPARGLLPELRFAHRIIHNALGLMTPEQKHDWSRLNDRDGVSGEGTTRAHERETLIEEAEIQPASFEVEVQSLVVAALERLDELMTEIRLGANEARLYSDSWYGSAARAVLNSRIAYFEGACSSMRLLLSAGHPYWDQPQDFRSASDSYRREIRFLRGPYLGNAKATVTTGAAQ